MPAEPFIILSILIGIFFTCNSIFYFFEEDKKLHGLVSLLPIIPIAVFFMFANTEREIVDTRFSDVYIHKNIAVGTFDDKPINLNREMSRNFDDPVTIKRETVIDWQWFVCFPKKYEYSVIECEQ